MIAVMLLLALPQSVAPECANASQRQDMFDCAQHAFDRRESAMTKQWTIALRAAEIEGRERAQFDTQSPALFRDELLAAQRAWIAFREAQCQLESSRSAGGWGQNIDWLNCMSRMAVERTQALRSFVEGL